MASKKLSYIQGINIQFPVVEWILEGKKTVETRKYPLPQKFIGKPLAIIETPGKRGKFKARVAGIIFFSRSFRYGTQKDFYKDSNKHLVTPELAEFSWEASGGVKYGWEIQRVIRFSSDLPKNFKKGIKYAKEVPVPSDILERV